MSEYKTREEYEEEIISSFLKKYKEELLFNLRELEKERDKKHGSDKYYHGAIIRSTEKSIEKFYIIEKEARNKNKSLFERVRGIFM